jgi:hypothetical protein
MGSLFFGTPAKAVLQRAGPSRASRPDRQRKGVLRQAGDPPLRLLLALEDIEPRNTKVRSPRTNGFVERMNRTLLDECFRIPGQQT